VRIAVSGELDGGVQQVHSSGLLRGKRNRRAAAFSLGYLLSNMLPLLL
jgi:hypothetical protein